MGLLVAIARKVQLNNLRFEYENKLLKIRSATSELMSQITDFEMLKNDLEPDSAEAKAFQERIERLNQVEKRLQEQQTKIETQIQMIDAEYNSCDQMIQSNIQKTFAA